MSQLSALNLSPHAFIWLMITEDSSIGPLMNTIGIVLSNILICNLSLNHNCHVPWKLKILVNFVKVVIERENLLGMGNGVEIVSHYLKNTCCNITSVLKIVL